MSSGLTDAVLKEQEQKSRPLSPVLDVVDLEVKYRTKIGTLSAIRGINFTVNPGEIVGIVGESGCGKSTVAAALTRLLPLNGFISSGQLLLNGRDLQQLSDEQMREVRGREISMIFQDAMTSLNPVFNIEQQMTDVILAHKKNSEIAIRGRRMAGEHAKKMLDRVGISDPDRRIKDYPHQFSGGMRQRVMIATALLSNPSLLIADEPTSALDVTLEAQINDLILKLRDERQTSILYITHNLGVIAQLCDQVLVLYAGSMMESGSVMQIFKNPLHPYTRALLNSHPARDTSLRRLATIPGRVPSLSDLPVGCKFSGSCRYVQKICLEREPELCQIDGQRVSCHMYDPAHKTDFADTRSVRNAAPATGAGVAAAAPAEEATLKTTAAEASEAAITAAHKKKDEVLLRINGLSTHFSNSNGILSRIRKKHTSLVKAVDNVSMDLRRGETLALVGESGSGKTTLGRTILRLEKPAGGEIIIEGRDITKLTQSKIRPMRLKMQMIFQDPITSLSPRKTVAALLLEPFKIHGVKVDKAAKVQEMLEMVGLSAEQADKYPHQLSGGQARRVGIARALALNPEVLIADEPTSGLDVSVAAEVLNLLKDLRERLSLTYIVITHNLNITSFVADRVAVMYLGRIVEFCDGSEMFASPKHPYTQALLSAVAVPDPERSRNRERIILEGEIPSPLNPPSGCHFHPRCRYRQERCSREVPELRSLSDAGVSYVACHYPLAVNSER